MKQLISTIGLIILICIIGCKKEKQEEEQNKAVPQAKIEITSSAFSYGEMIPKKYTADGEDISPSLKWTKLPEGTKSLVLICDDPDAPMRTWVHWVMYAIPPEQDSLPEGIGKEAEVLNGIKQGKNDFHKFGYGGPSPPKGKPHRYYFRLYAIDIIPDLTIGATKSDVMNAIKGHIIAQGNLMARYQR
ncbi:MAG: YbhB/YbcL family Raf kinase inhibitor-like protein [Candidatus Cloacimonadota bacterium]|nr:MAG: YbhB/YbcL family Raf kinase inhibitor-like protein [Candidatus Cloacimonadota bacterium]